jgi:hypothetical protein
MPNTSNISNTTNNTNSAQQPQYIQPGNTRQGTGFVNLQQFLNANQNNQLGNTIGSGVNNYANNVQTGLGTANQQFQQDVASNSYNTPQNNQYVSNTLGNIQNYGQSNPASGGNNNVGANNQALINPSSQAPLINQNDINQFATYRAGGYNGPNQLENTQQLTGQAQQAQNLGQATLTEPGRQELLQQFVGNQNPYAQYNQGEQNLDTLLLGQQQPQLQQANRATQGLVSNVNNQIGLSQQQAQNAAAQNQQFAQTLNNQLANTTGNVESGITNQLTQDQQAQQNLYSNLQQQLNSGNLDPNGPLANLIGSNYYNVNAVNDLTQAATPTLANVGTQANQAQLNALSQLSGNSAASNFLPTLATPFNLSNNVTFNQPQFQTQANAAQQNLQTALNAPLSTVDSNIPAQGYTNSDLNGGSYTGSTPAQTALQQLQARVTQEQQQPGNIYLNSDQANLAALQTYINNVNNQYGANNIFKGGSIPQSIQSINNETRS